MLPVKRFKFKDEAEALNAMIALFRVDESGELITNSRDHSISMIGSPDLSEYDEEGNLINKVVIDGFHVNVTTREPLDVTDNVIDPLTPWFKVQGE